MSEKIKIAIVIDDEKSNADKKDGVAPSLILTQDASVTLMPVFLKNHLMTGSFCGQRGDCGRCIVQFTEGAPLPTGLERAQLTPKELQQGYRLACVTRPRMDCTIKIAGGNDVETPIVTELNLPSENIDLSSHKILQSRNQKSDAMKFSEKRGEDSIKNNCYIIAVDLGTTTVAMQMRDMVTGEIVDTYCENNPQRCYGTDVLSRIEASCNGAGEELRELICESLARGLKQFAGRLRKRQIAGMCIAGNTTMEHLLLGYDVKGLGVAPFVPVEKGLQKISLAALFSDRITFVGEFPVYIAPCISAFVGGDIVAGLYALHMLPIFGGQETAGERTAEDAEGTGRKRTVEDAEGTGRERTAEDVEGAGQNETLVRLLIDLGTNGEMAITDGRRMIVTATAAGPAFEGNGDLIGTDRIAFTASLLRQGALDETGLLEEPYFETGVRMAKSGCYFRQEDIRALQMAKAAIRAGVEILWEEMGCPEVERIYLAGGFGYYLDVEAAFAIGLLPSDMRGKVQAVGNTSLAGAFALGRDLCMGSVNGEAAGKTAVSDVNMAAYGIESINLAERDGFEKLYLRYMNLEEN